MTWWEHVLTYQLPDRPALAVVRSLTVGLGAVCIYFSIHGRRWSVGRDRRLIYGLIGLLTVMQEGNQLAAGAPFLVWRLPLLLVLVITCLVSMRRYVREAP